MLTGSCGDSRPIQVAVYTVVGEESESEVNKCQIWGAEGNQLGNPNLRSVSYTCLCYVCVIVFCFEPGDIWGVVGLVFLGFPIRVQDLALFDLNNRFHAHQIRPREGL